MSEQDHSADMALPSLQEVAGHQDHSGEMPPLQGAEHRHDPPRDPVLDRLQAIEDKLDRLVAIMRETEGNLLIYHHWPGCGAKFPFIPPSICPGCGMQVRALKP